MWEGLCSSACLLALKVERDGADWQQISLEHQVLELEHQVLEVGSLETGGNLYMTTDPRGVLSLYLCKDMPPQNFKSMGLQTLK